MAGTSEGARKAAQSRSPESKRRAGQAGANALSHEQRVKIGKEAAETRKSRDPKAFEKMGEKGAAALTHEQRVKIGKEAAKTRGHESLAEAGKKGGESRGR